VSLGFEKFIHGQKNEFNTLDKCFNYFSHPPIEEIDNSWRRQILQIMLNYHHFKSSFSRRLSAARRRHFFHFICRRPPRLCCFSMHFFIVCMHCNYVLCKPKRRSGTQTSKRFCVVYLPLGIDTCLLKWNYVAASINDDLVSGRRYTSSKLHTHSARGKMVVYKDDNLLTLHCRFGGLRGYVWLLTAGSRSLVLIPSSSTLIVMSI
jgi:hypothetical protein